MREYAYKKEEKNERIIKQVYSMLLINIFDAPNYSYSNMISGLQSFMAIVSESQSVYEETLNCILNNAERKIAQKGVFITVSFADIRTSERKKFEIFKGESVKIFNR